MQNCRLGDNVFRDDSATEMLEQKAAARVGKEAALFTPSGTMGNLLAILTHCQGRGHEIIVGSKAHIFLYEAGGSAALGGVHSRTLENRADGTLDLDQIRASIQAEDVHNTTTRLVCLENTQGLLGGQPLSLEYTQSVGKLVREAQLRLHIDGARLFNASVALGVDVKHLVAPADSVMFCLSKGLAAPIGSLLAGSEEFIYQARKLRKMLGGGMRQTGMLAEAGMVALEDMPAELAVDHQMAKRLAAGLAKIDLLELEYPEPATNMVYVRLKPKVSLSVEEITAQFKALGVLVWGNEKKRNFRLVTHYAIREPQVDQIVKAFYQILQRQQ